jgi:hypothetical protein
MATADPFPDAAAAAVASQLGAFFPQPAEEGVGPAAPPRRELTESLAVCFLEARQVRRPPKDLSVLARPSGVWHHQVRTGGAATHLARSQQSGLAEGAGAVEVQQLAETPIAGQIDRAMAWVDKNVKGRATVRLLVAPAYYLHALLIVRGEKLSAVLADQPPGFTQLEYEREYPLADFLKRLGKEKAAGTLTG